MPKPLHKPRDGWDRHSIKAELHRQGMTIGKLGELAGMSGKAFSKVWTTTHRKAEKAIADFLETPAKELWPGRYPVSSSQVLSSKYDQMGASEKSPPLSDRASGQSSDQEAA